MVALPKPQKRIAVHATASAEQLVSGCPNAHVFSGITCVSSLLGMHKRAMKKNGIKRAVWPLIKCNMSEQRHVSKIYRRAMFEQLGELLYQAHAYRIESDAHTGREA